MSSLGPSLAMTALSIGEVLLAIGLFCRQLPRREPFWQRLALMAVLAIAVAIAYTWLIDVRFPQFAGRLSFQTHIVSYTLMLAACVVGLMSLFDVSLWTSLFCCTAGYIVQNAAVGLGSTLLCAARLARLDLSSDTATFVVRALALVLIYLAATRAFVSPLEQRRLGIVENRMILLVMALVFLVNIVLDLVNVTLEDYGVPLSMVLVLRLVHLALCAFMLVMEYQMLYAKRLQTEVETMRRLREEEARQLRLSRENIDAVNERVAEVRAQISRLEEAGAGVDADTLASITRRVGVYDSAVKTGNETLDILLAEKSLICEHEGITLTCIADGAALSFMEQSDLYSLLGNAIENAIDAVRALDDPEKRAIGLTVRRVGTGDAVALNVENYFEGELEFVDGLPQTTKGSELVHGFGMRAMQSCVERYGGTLRARAEGGIFHLNALLVPQTHEGGGTVRVNPLAAAAASRGIGRGGI